MSTVVNSEDPYEMLCDVAFHQGLHLGKIVTCMWSLNINNGPSQVYCIKPEGRIHLYKKG